MDVVQNLEIDMQARLGTSEPMAENTSDAVLHFGRPSAEVGKSTHLQGETTSALPAHLATSSAAATH